MTCAERADAIWLHAAGLLEGHELEELRAHLNGGCPRCTRELEQARELLTSLPASLAPLPPPAAVRERLLDRARVDAQRVSRAQARVTLRAALAAGIAAAFVAGGGALLTWFALVAPALESQRATELERDELAHARAELEAEKQELEKDLENVEAELRTLKDSNWLAVKTVELLRRPDLEIAVLKGTERQPEARGRVFWDRENYLCYMHVQNLEPPTEGRRFVFWVTTDQGETVAAGVIEPGYDGEATLFTELPRHIRGIVRAVLTEEPAEYGPAPTGASQLVWSSS